MAKKIFGNENRREILVSFLNAVLALPEGTSDPCPAADASCDGAVEESDLPLVIASLFGTAPSASCNP